MYHILDYSHVVITTINAQSLYMAWEIAVQRLGYYYNVYAVKAS